MVSGCNVIPTTYAIFAFTITHEGCLSSHIRQYAIEYSSIVVHVMFTFQKYEQISTGIIYVDLR